ncbi:MAG: hypothetical protein JKY55_19990 [Aliivibrio sp.]|uniref:hypothetical protein n=1 Tax=Aliivibrio sp. TaxID=1872443 RepID=UPI001A41752D|nr:hypothetical protein [Aliivibrio sp.]
MRARKYTHLDLKRRIETGLAHIHVPAAGLPRALLYLFGRPEVTLSLDQQERIVGRYRLPSGHGFEIVSENGSLRIIGCACEELGFGKVTMIAETPNKLYLRYIGVSIEVVDPTEDIPTQIRVDRNFEGRAKDTLIATRIF